MMFWFFGYWLLVMVLRATLPLYYIVYVKKEEMSGKLFIS